MSWLWRRAAAVVTSLCVRITSFVPFSSFLLSLVSPDSSDAGRDDIINRQSTLKQTFRMLTFVVIYNGWAGENTLCEFAVAGDPQFAGAVLLVFFPPPHGIATP